MKCSRSGGRGSQALQSSSGVATMFFQVCIFSYLIAGFFLKRDEKRSPYFESDVMCFT